MLKDHLLELVKKATANGQSLISAAHLAACVWEKEDSFDCDEYRALEWHANHDTRELYE